MRHVYLDFNTTAPLAPSVLEAMSPYLGDRFHVPSQTSSAGSVVWEAVELARERVGALFGCPQNDIFFTSGGSEANHTAILGHLLPHQHQGGVLLVGATEHDGVLAAARMAAQLGFQVQPIPCDPFGYINPSSVAGLLSKRTRLVCVQAANGVLGCVQSVRQIADLCHQQGVPLHCDATRACGQVPLTVTDLHADSVAISGHRVCGPKGVGALMVRSGPAFDSLVGTSSERPELQAEHGLASGFKNVAAAVGMGAAARMARRALDDAVDVLAELRDRFVQRIEQSLGCQLSPHGHGPCLSNTACVELPSGAIGRALDELNELTLRTATSFDPPDEFARCLFATGRSQEAVRRTFTASVGWTTSRDDIDRAADWICEKVERIIDSRC